MDQAVDERIGEFFDLAIVGGGPVAMALALGLAETPLSVLLIGNTPPPVIGQLGFDLRSVTLNPGSEAFLSELGVWPLIKEEAAPITSIEAWDHEGSGFIRFTAEEADRDQLGHLVQSGHLEKALWQRCHDHPGLTCLSRLVSTIIRQPGNSLLQLEDGSRYGASLMVGADGAESLVRKSFGIECREWSYGQSALVSLVEVSKGHDQCAIQSFTEDGPLALLPLPDPHFCVLIFSVETQAVESYLAMEDTAFRDTLSRLSDHRFGQVLAVDRRTVIPLTQKHAVRYVGEGVLLLGDAAHRLHPLAGQGLNLGLRDARQATRLLKRAAAAGLSVRDAAVLERYDRDRQADNLTFTALIEAFRRGYGASPLARLGLRNWLMSQVDNTRVLKKLFLSAALGHYFLAG